MPLISFLRIVLADQQHPLHSELVALLDITVRYFGTCHASVADVSPRLRLDADELDQAVPRLSRRYGTWFSATLSRLVARHGSSALQAAWNEAARPGVRTKWDRRRPRKGPQPVAWQADDTRA